MRLNARAASAKSIDSIPPPPPPIVTSASLRIPKKAAAPEPPAAVTPTRQPQWRYLPGAARSVRAAGKPDDTV